MGNRNLLILPSLLIIFITFQQQFLADAHCHKCPCCCKSLQSSPSKSRCYNNKKESTDAQEGKQFNNETFSKRNVNFYLTFSKFCTKCAFLVIFTFLVIRSTGTSKLNVHREIRDDMRTDTTASITSKGGIKFKLKYAEWFWE